MPRIEILDLAPKDAVNHFRAKGYHIGFDWRDTSAAQHLTSFTVAKVAQIDILEDIRKAVDAAIAKGWTFERFRRELEPLLRKKGWWGRKMMRDPLTGETRAVQLGSVRRLRIIFDTNIRMAYARGRWQAIERLAHVRPWLRYVAVLDERTRPEHARWHGTILRWDHPSWQTHYPPCGWNCRCTVQQLSERDLERFGFTPSQEPPEDWNRTRPWHNARTNETIDVPIGIDPGFEHNVGLLRPDASVSAVLKARAAAAAPDIAAAVTRRDKPEDWIAEGRKRRERMVEQAGGIDAPDFVDRFREDLRNSLREERGAGTVHVQIEVGEKGSRTASRVRKAAGELPASWVTKGNTLPLTAIGASDRGGYLSARDGRPAQISVATDVGNPLHEYFHHLQRAMPKLDGLFAALHHRRTKGDPRVQIGRGKNEIGRTDDYILEYAGREYDPGEQPREVLTMGMQQLFHPLFGREYLRNLVRDDPEMLDLLLGVLFGYDP